MNLSIGLEIGGRNRAQLGFPSFGAQSWSGWFGDTWPAANDLYDYSGAGNTSVLTGTLSRSTGYVVTADANYLTVPITDTALYNAGTAGDFTVMGVFKWLNNTLQGTILATENTSATQGVSLFVSASGNTAFAIYDGTTTQTLSITAATAGSEGSWEFTAATFDSGGNAVLYRRGPSDGAMLTTTAAITPAFTGSARNFRMGRTHAASKAGGVQHAGAALYNRVLTAAEIGEAYTAAKAFAAAYPGLSL